MAGISRFGPEPMANKGYLIGLGTELEREAVRRSFYVRPMLENLIQDLGFNYPFFWAVLELPKSRVLDESRKIRKLSGDIDVLLGRIELSASSEEIQARINASAFHKPELNRALHEHIVLTQILQRGEIRWPPPPDYLAGIEAKSSLLKVEAISKRIASGKTGPGKIRKLGNELRSLIALGLDRAVLLEIIATPPQSSFMSGQPWLKASATASEANELFRPISERRILPDPRVDRWRLSIGAVGGATEEFSGAGCAQIIQRGIRLENWKINSPVRQELGTGVSQLLGSIPRPRALPLLMVYCSLCRSLHDLTSTIWSVKAPCRSKL
jgi:hypothetical protein